MNKTLAVTMATDLIRYHGLDQKGWKVGFKSFKSSLGSCNYSLKTIFLSEPITEINSEDGVLNTITHEVAHALVGSGAGHNSLWKATAKAIGCDGERVNTVVDKHLIAKWQYTCQKCGFKHYTHRRLKDLGNRRHTLDYGSFTENLLQRS